MQRREQLRGEHARAARDVDDLANPARDERLALAEHDHRVEQWRSTLARLERAEVAARVADDAVAASDAAIDARFNHQETQPRRRQRAAWE